VFPFGWGTRQLSKDIGLKKLDETCLARDLFAGAALEDRPDLKQVVDRYLSQARIKYLSDGVVFQVPTHIHRNRLTRWKTELENIGNTKILDIEVLRSPRPRREPSTSAPAQQQVSLPLAPQNPKRNIEEIERQRRFSAPQFISSPAYELSHALLSRWANGVDIGSGDRVVWVHGNPGSGKTHLLKQLSGLIPLAKNLKRTTVLGFLSEWRQSLDTKDISFKNKYRRETDVLILEDLHDLVGKVGTQKEILFTIDSLMARGAYIAVSSSPPPTELKDQLDPMLYSRLFSGTTIEMPKPDRGFKESLWRYLLEQHGLKDFELDMMLQEKLLGVEVESARKANTLLINAVARVSVKRGLSTEDLRSLELTHSSTANTSIDPSLNPADYISKVAELCGVSSAAIIGNGRRAQVTLARRFVCLSLSKQLGLTNATISHYLEKDPSSISHCLKKVETDIENNRHIAKQWNWICSQLGIPNKESN